MKSDPAGNICVFDRYMADSKMPKTLSYLPLSIQHMQHRNFSIATNQKLHSSMMIWARLISTHTRTFTNEQYIYVIFEQAKKMSQFFAVA